MTKTCSCSMKGRLKPQHSTLYVCIQRQKGRKITNNCWLDLKPVKKKTFFSTRDFDVISTISNKSEISYQPWDMQSVFNSACRHHHLNRIQCQWEVWWWIQKTWLKEIKVHKTICRPLWQKSVDVQSKFILSLNIRRHMSVFNVKG